MLRIAPVHDDPPLSPDEKLRIVCELHDLGVTMMRETLARRFPQASRTEIDARLDAWLAERPGAENGDGVGRPVAWPRPACRSVRR